MYNSTTIEKRCSEYLRWGEELNIQKDEPIIEIQNIKKTFGYAKALDGMNFCAFPGEVTAIVGDNGSGKSTLIKILSGCLRPDSGEIEIKGKKFASLTVKQAIQQESQQYIRIWLWIIVKIVRKIFSWGKKLCNIRFSWIIKL